MTRGVSTILRLVTALGALAFLAGVSLAPERAWVAFLVAFVALAGIAVCGPLFLSLLTLTRARWPGELRRIPEALTSVLPFAALLGIVLVSGAHSLYEWSHASAVLEDPLLAHKSPYLNVPGFALRLALCFAAWIVLGRRLIRALHAEEEHPGVAASRRSIRSAAAFLAVFAITFSIASFDWIQSLEPHWFSTIFALVVTSTVVQAGLAACFLIAAWIDSRRIGAPLLDRERVEDVGRLMIGFSLFWVYIGYCQHMLIWYTNMPEETSWYLPRAQGEWAVVQRACVVACWLVPFLSLLPKRWRRSKKAVGRAAATVLAGSLLHLHYLVAPSHYGDSVGAGVLEILLPLAALAAVAWITLRAYERLRGPSSGSGRPVAHEAPLPAVRGATSRA